jgi:hypothetical protein
MNTQLNYYDLVELNRRAACNIFSLKGRFALGAAAKIDRPFTRPDMS